MLESRACSLPVFRCLLPVSQTHTRRRFLTFTLRSLLVLISIFGAILGIWVNRLRTQQAIVREVEGLGGQVWNVDCGSGQILAEYPSWLPSSAWPLVPMRLNY